MRLRRAHIGGAAFAVKLAELGAGAMCNLYSNKVSPDAIVRAFEQLRIPLALPEGLPNAEPREEIRITDRAPILRWGEGAAELVQRRWSWPGPGGKPVYNFRSDG